MAKSSSGNSTKWRGSRGVFAGTPKGIRMWLRKGAVWKAFQQERPKAEAVQK